MVIFKENTCIAPKRDGPICYEKEFGIELVEMEA